MFMRLSQITALPEAFDPFVNKIHVQSRDLGTCPVAYQGTLTVAPGKKSQFAVSGGSKLSSMRGAL